MKAERELVWLIKLRKSEFMQGWFKSRSGSKTDFEKLVGAPINSKEFHEWFNEMRDEGVIIVVEEAGDNSQWNKFMVDKKACDQRIKENRYNKILHAYYTRDQII